MKLADPNKRDHRFRRIHDRQRPQYGRLVHGIRDKRFNWVEVSIYCDFADDVRAVLAQHWDVESLYGKLWGHNDFASRVIWPTELTDQPLFEFAARQQSTWRKLTSLGSGLIDKDLTVK